MDCTVFPMKNRGGVRLPTTRVCLVRMAAAASSASSASIYVTPSPTVAAKCESLPATMGRPSFLAFLRALALAMPKRCLEL
jgi:hypothetical protein